MFTPIKNRKMYVLVAEQIGGLIEDGSLKKGERLPSERDLATQLGISRSTIREALTALEIQGFIEVRSGLGTYILGVPDKDIRFLLDNLDNEVNPYDLFESRMLILPVLTNLAAQRATEDDIDKLNEISLKTETIGDDDFIAFEELDKILDIAIAKAAHNEVLYKFLDNITCERLGTLWSSLKAKSLQKPGRIKKGKSEHMEIIRLIVERNPTKAEHVMAAHLKSAKRYIFGE